MKTRIAFAIAAILLLVVAVFHGTAVGPLAAKVEGARLGPFLVGGFRAVWLGFSLAAVIVALIVGFEAIRPSASSTRHLLLLSGIPLGSSALIYLHLGAFLGGHLLLAAGAAIVLGALWSTPGLCGTDAKR